MSGVWTPGVVWLTHLIIVQTKHCRGSGQLSSHRVWHRVTVPVSWQQQSSVIRLETGESNVNLIREKCSDCHLNRNISAPVDEEVVWRGMRDYDPLLCKVQSLLSIDDITWGSLITTVVSTGVCSPIWGDRALSYEWVITPGLLREALATVLIPAPPPRDTHWSPAPAQKLMLFCQDLRSLL